MEYTAPCKDPECGCRTIQGPKPQLRIDVADPEMREWAETKMYGAEERVVDPRTGGAKGRKGIEIGFVDPLALMELGKVASEGSRKYEAFNYLKGFNWSLSYNAMQRHAMQFWAGETLDPDSATGTHHLASVAWHALALLSFTLRDLGNDDRPPESGA